MSLTVQEFLRRKGAIGMLSMLHERPMTYSELAPQIEITSSTITERRDEAAELGLLEVNLGEAEVGTKKVYELTDMGEFLTDQMARQGIVSNYRKMRALQELLDEQTDDFAEWVETNPSQLLQFPEAEEGTITKREIPQDDGEDSEMESSESTDISDSTFGEGQITSKQDDSSLDHPDPPSERQSSEEEEIEGGETDERSALHRRPSDMILDDGKEPDPESMSQGTFSDMGADEESSDSEHNEE
ncbi:ArsR family transcriptional regulator [Haloterrigena sp. H1]|uniref:winged helix-turn-helix domain-containing protein n=1 Tax=Haloterrigena sp. H1 TaxID=2552943 RepID=UPI00110E9F9D|nr:winged helix-turn-helix domain-containing protein [Haloterrigena sp. H1]TMT81376.1 ArsR family transcriptional regulator [Haloterrigena sp. H1]